jgi:ubiquinone/menaquinone biosynthesis C-methylase UbiE
MDAEKRDFDKEAATWDEEPTRVKLAKDVSEAILSEVTLTSDMDVLDFGCGTGLVTLALQPAVRSITGADTSQGMIDVLEAKISKLRLPNVKALHIDPDKDDIPGGPYHLILSSMTLHHVAEIKPLLTRLHRLIVPSGHLCIADLDPDDGRFHDNNKGIFHFGFERGELRRALTEAGFVDIRDRTASEVQKPAPGGEMRRFTIFLITGRKA